MRPRVISLLLVVGKPVARRRFPFLFTWFLPFLLPLAGNGRASRGWGQEPHASPRLLGQQCYLQTTSILLYMLPVWVYLCGVVNSAVCRPISVSDYEYSYVRDGG